MLHETLTVLDLEATGLHPEAGDRMTEIGLVRIENGRITARWHSLVNCGERLSASNIAYTGITQAMVDGAPTPRPVLERAFEFIGDTPVVSHGAAFDQTLIEFECERAGLVAPAAPFLCSLQLARRTFRHLREHSLAALAHSLKLGTTDRAHRAAADAELTAKLVLRLGHSVPVALPARAAIETALCA